MATTFTQQSREETEQITATLRQLDTILASGKVTAVDPETANALRRTVKKLLVDFSTNLSALEELERNDIFKTDPTLAGQRFRLIQNIESSKIDFEFDVLPQLQKLTAEAVQEIKSNPPESVTTEGLPDSSGGEAWTPAKVISFADGLVDQGTKAVKIASKAAFLVRALAAVVGVPIP